MQLKKHVHALDLHNLQKLACDTIVQSFRTLYSNKYIDCFYIHNDVELTSPHMMRFKNCIDKHYFKAFQETSLIRCQQHKKQELTASHECEVVATRHFDVDSQASAFIINISTSSSSSTPLLSMSGL